MPKAAKKAAAKTKRKVATEATKIEAKQVAKQKPKKAEKQEAIVEAIARAAAEGAASGGGGSCADKRRNIGGPLSEEQLKRLRKHRYSCCGSSILDPPMQLLWNAMLKFVPLWAAPNAITLFGLLLNACGTVALAACSPNAASELPLWACALAAVTLLTYQTLDALDGKQARRTGTSTPLGELFDHGCDALSVLLVAVGHGVAVGLGSQSASLLLVHTAGWCTLFYCVHWMCYVTGELRFGCIDVTELQMTVVAAYLATGLVGVDELWSAELPFVEVTARIAQFSGLAFAVALVASRLVPSILFGGVGKNGSTVANSSVLYPGLVWSLPLLLACCAAPSDTEQSCQYAIALGLPGVKYTIRLIVAHMTKSGLALLDSSLLCPIALLLNQLAGEPVPEWLALPAVIAFGCADCLLYWILLCRQIGAYLGVPVLTIRSLEADPPAVNDDDTTASMSSASTNYTTTATTATTADTTTTPTTNSNESDVHNVAAQSLVSDTISSACAAFAADGPGARRRRRRRRDTLNESE